ncbi:SepM family pheromone-processing serine protease [Weissella koreensis]|uniref:PDZ domain-containing protein n=2 Tax=Weissella koreensis TaxID=165096 RepID=A0A7H1MK41_9LACO|nr:SepM family pheromone-processing serine protease [Weissella koreensis]AVH74568.1 PDZ domain-containing protein [Weissella koreensis]EJF33917.1 S16 family peptidase [Weissella koreensis KCTC 3621]EJF34207.1 S16 family peptidase [Weissella koreensis KCTC 3621]QGN19792.1 PDZ domain-containing protein [Weissella koreensis]QNT63827.1 PDZ domain-containing protein [Weissella koreensis]
MRPLKTKYKWLIWSIIAILLAGFLMMPLPLYSESPGISVGLKNFIKVDNKKPNFKGDYSLTAISLSQLTGLGALITLTNPHADFMTKDQVMAGATSSEEQKIDKIDMDTAFNNAKAVALKKAGIDYKENFKGVYVRSLQPNSKFKKDLKIGDMITKINGEKQASVTDFQSTIRNHKLGDPITITYSRNNKQYNSTHPTVSLGGANAKIPGIGILLIDHTTISTKPKITADMGKIGGPSGGLMFSLELYEALSNNNLAQGRLISGTGTIDREGNVGEIGGIDKKVISAGESGSKIFFAPYLKVPDKYLKYEEKHQTNYQLAKKTAQKYEPQLKVVPVSNFQQALDYLEAHPVKEENK